MKERLDHPREHRDGILSMPPPNEPDAEQEVLGSMLQADGGTEAAETARAILKASDFYNSYHQRLYKAILELHDSGGPVDDLLAPQYQRIYRDIDKIGDMSPPAYIDYLRHSIPSAANIEYYAEKVLEAARLREIIRIVSTVNAIAYTPDIDGITSAELIGLLQDLIIKSETLSSIAGQVPTAKDDWPEVFNRLCESQRSEFLGLRTGFEQLDNATLGLRGLSVLGGIPGQGKSSWALQVACEIARLNNVPVLFYALEMSKVDLYIKTISRLSKLDYETLGIGSEIEGRRGRGLSEEDTHKLSEGTSEFMRYADRVRIVDRSVCREISLPVVRLHIQQAKREHEAEEVFVVIDHLQILPCEKPGLDDMKSRLDYLVAEFKAISEQYNATVLLISEKNRSSYEKEWLGAFMGSAGIEYGVDLALLLYEPGEEGKSEADKDERDMELRIVKNRFGKTKRINLRFYGAYSHFGDGGGIGGRNRG